MLFYFIIITEHGCISIAILTNCLNDCFMISQLTFRKQLF